MPRERLKLYVWKDFIPDYTSGLAFAIAHNEEEAMEMVVKQYPYNIYNWGTLSIHPLNKPFAASVEGGG